MTDNGMNTALADGWVWTTLGEVTDKPQYGWTTKASPAGALRFLRTTDISKGPIDWTAVPYCNEDPDDPSRYLLAPGDLVISRAGSVGLSALIGEVPPAVFASYLIRFRPTQQIDARYLAWNLKGPEYWRHIADRASGIALQNVNARTLSTIPVPLPPLPEQHRIVAAIETHLTRLDAAVAALERARARLKRYRAAVLKAACEGRLVPTEAHLARTEGRPYEPAPALLARVLEERATAGVNGRVPAQRKWAVAVLPSDLPKLPDGWTWSTWQEVADRITVGFVGPMKHEYVPKGVPFLRSQNVRENRFDSQGLLYVSSAFHERIRKSTLLPGDLVVVRSGSVGVTCVIPDALGEANCSDLVVIQGPKVVPRFGAYYMNSLARQRVQAGQTGSALIHFNTQSVADMPVPIPPLAEQERIVAEVERRLSVLDQLDAAVTANLKRADALRQSVLRRAFAGNLVAPDDQPA